MDSRLKECTRTDQSSVYDSRGSDGYLLGTEKLPNWAVRALQLSSSEDSMHSERSVSSHPEVFHRHQDLFHFEAPEDFSSIASISPPPSLPPSLPPSSLHVSMERYHEVSREYPHAAYPRMPVHFAPLSEPSQFAHRPTTTTTMTTLMNSSTEQLARFLHGSPPDDPETWPDQTNYRSSSDVVASPGKTSQICNGNFQAVTNDYVKKCHPEINHQMATAVYHGDPNVNAYLRGYEFNDRNRYEPGAVSGGRYQPGADDYGYPRGAGEVIYSQGRPLMSSHPQQDRMLYSHYRPYPVYPGPGMTSCHLPVPNRPSRAGEFYQNPSAFYRSPLSDAQSFVSAFPSPVYGRFHHDHSEERRHNSREGLDNLKAVSGMRDARPQPSQSSPSTESSRQPHSVPDKTSPARPENSLSITDEAKTNLKKMDQEMTEGKNSVDQSICETGKPCISSSGPNAPESKSPNPERPNPERSKPDEPKEGEKDDRSPVAYTILFSPREEAAKPPELSDRKFVMQRAKSQDRSPLAKTLSEFKKPNPPPKFSPRIVSAKQKTNVDVQERQPRRSRASTKSGIHEKEDWMTQSFNEAYSQGDRGRSFGAPGAKKLAKTSGRKSADVGITSISDEEEFDALSESGTYVIEDENSQLKTFRENIPHVFGVDLDGCVDGEDEEKSSKEKIRLRNLPGSSVDPHKREHLDVARKNNSTTKNPPSLPARRVLPEAPEIDSAPEKITTKKKTTTSESFDSISKWLTNSAMVAAKPPPSANNIYSTRSIFAGDVDKEDSPNFHRNRKTDTTALNSTSNGSRTSQNQIGQRENFRTDSTFTREGPGRRSVDPQTRSVKIRSIKASKNSNSFVDDGSSSQMSKSWISNGFDAHFNPSIPPGRPTRPRSTSRPRMPKTSTTAVRKPVTPSIECKSAAEAEVPTLSKAKQAPSDRICAPTIATELKSKRNPPVREPTSVLRCTPPVHNTSCEEIPTFAQARSNKKKISRSKTLDPEEFSSTVEKSKSSSSGDKLEVKDGERSADMSQKVARLTEKFLRDTEELLRDSGADTHHHSGLEEMLTHLKAHPIGDGNVLAAVSNLLKLQVHSSDKNGKAATKERLETTF